MGPLVAAHCAPRESTAFASTRTPSTGSGESGHGRSDDAPPTRSRPRDGVRPARLRPVRPVMRLTGTVLSTKAPASRRGRLVRLHPSRVRRHAHRAGDGRIRAGRRPRARRSHARLAFAGCCIRIVGRVAMDVCVIDIGDAAVRAGRRGRLLRRTRRGASPSIAEWMAATGSHGRELVTADRTASAAGGRRMSAGSESTSDALRANLAPDRRPVAPAQHMLVVKDDAYGHGLEPIVHARLGRRVRWFGAFDVRTGTLCGPSWAPDARDLRLDRRHGDEVAARRRRAPRYRGRRRRLLEDVAQAARRRRVARVHLKIDTGLHRNGVRPEEWPAFVARAAELERRGPDRGRRASGATSPRPRTPRTTPRARSSRRRWERRRGRPAASAVPPPGGQRRVFARPEFRYDLVRVGAFAYGIRSGRRTRRGGARHPSDRAAGRRGVGGATATPPRSTSAQLDGLPSTLAGRLAVGTPAGPRPSARSGAYRSTVDGWPAAALGDEVIVFGAGRAR